MTEFWKKKKFWVIAVGMGGLLIAGYLLFSLRGDSVISTGSQIFPPDALLQDKEPPTLAIESPEQRTWISRDFSVSVFEEDLETTIVADSCTFQVCAYDKNDKEQCTGVMQRVCGEQTPAITVGPGGMCSFEGREACFVYVEAQDLAGNKGGSYGSYHIDFTPPSIQEVSLQKEGEGYVVQAEVVDNTGVAVCGLYANERFVNTMEFQENCREACEVSTIFQSEEIESRLFIRCDDIARNSSDGKELVISRNEAPTIASCRVSPTKGTPETLFHFSLEASDPNKDHLSYQWEVANGIILQDKDVVHQYTVPGTYMPKVTVQDSEDLQAQCSTAWVVVE